MIASLNELSDAQLVLIRGLPGSGKSTLAKEISKTCGYVHFENDMFFEVNGVYAYDPDKVLASQQWCLRGARDALFAGRKVVVSNCFTKREDMRSFLDLTDSVAVIECSGDYGSVHDIPADVLERKRASWRPYPGAIRI